MRRILARLPDVYSLEQLEALTLEFFPTLIGGVFILPLWSGPHLAGYVPDFDQTRTDRWATAVEAHVPVHPTPEELELQREAVAATLRDRAIQGLATNQTYLAIATPTAAQVRDQTRVLTVECSALIRLALGRLESDT